MTGWGAALRVYREKRILAVLAMGFSSGLPLALSGATLTFWLSEAGVSRGGIGLFALVGFAYGYKFLWSPFLDRVPLPWLTRRLGRRRSWALLIQLLLAAAIAALGQSDPATALGTTAALAVAVAFLSASQDIVIDAWRIELLRPEQQGAGAAATQWGYRMGMLAAGAGAFYVAHFGGWGAAYLAMAALMGVGIATTLLTPEPEAIRPRLRPGESWLASLLLRPFADFFERSRGAAVAILAFILLYKLGEALAGYWAGPLYRELGFDRIEVANIQKVFGVIATLAGVALGGAVVARLGVLRALLVGGFLQMLSNLMYVAQVWAGHDLAMLTLSIFVENFTNGMGSAAFVAYLSGLCSPGFTATQYALFSSLTTLGSRLATSPSGWLVDALGWVPFFLLTTVAALPALVLLAALMRRRAALPPASVAPSAA